MSPALDRLRGLAVLAVIGFHCQGQQLPGGFIGVDVFFVLSGYLVTSILCGELSRSERIDFAGFYLLRPASCDGDGSRVPLTSTITRRRTHSRPGVTHPGGEAAGLD